MKQLRLEAGKPEANGAFHSVHRTPTATPCRFRVGRSVPEDDRRSLTYRTVGPKARNGRPTQRGLQGSEDDAIQSQPCRPVPAAEVLGPCRRPLVLGLRATVLEAKTSINPIDSLSPLEPDTQLVGLGPLVTSDSRDNRFFPTQGSYAESVASRKDHVNVRIDCAVGPDDDAVYFRIGEAF